MIIDPVCGMHMDPEKAPAFYTYQEHTYYFCSDDCMEKFKAHPEQYIDKAIEMNPAGYGAGDCSKAA